MADSHPASFSAAWRPTSGTFARMLRILCVQQRTPKFLGQTTSTAHNKPDA